MDVARRAACLEDDRNPIDPIREATLCQPLRLQFIGGLFLCAGTIPMCGAMLAMVNQLLKDH